jgi:hypothetical protein
MPCQHTGTHLGTAASTAGQLGEFDILVLHMETSENRAMLLMTIYHVPQSSVKGKEICENAILLVDICPPA